ncbi:MAG: thioredoxin family protein [Verrucomicrobiales bacterium]|nr:thioredoxin family protein [Verrucomicrobiales bacterium]
MARVALLGLVAVLLAVGCAPEPAQLPWITDFAKAQTLAVREQKLLLMDFTGSDWCQPCKNLKRYLLETREFADYAASNLVLLEVDFPRWTSLPEPQKKANEALQAEYTVEGFPTLILLAPQGKVLGRQAGVQQTKPAELIAWIEDLRRQSPPPTQ